MKKLFLVTIVIITGCSVKERNETNIKSDIFTDVSMIQVIANPEKYDGKKVELKCYFIMQFEENVIYFSEMDYEHSVYKNALWLSISREFVLSQEINPPFKGYIDIEGTFIKNKPGSSSAFSGTLTDITYMRRLYKRDGTISE